MSTTPIFTVSIMNPNDFINTITENLRKILPPGIDQFKADWDKNLHSIIMSALAKLDIVTREEFDIQTKVLARTRAKVEALEVKILACEQLLNHE